MLGSVAAICHKYWGSLPEAISLSLSLSLSLGLSINPPFFPSFYSYSLMYYQVQKSALTQSSATVSRTDTTD